MQAWAAELAEARAVLHDELSLSATYTPPGGAVVSPVHVRLLRDLVKHGDLDRQGFAQARDDINYVVFDTTELPSVVRQGVFKVVGYDDPFTVEGLQPKDGRFQTARIR